MPLHAHSLDFEALITSIPLALGKIDNVDNAIAPGTTIDLTLHTTNPSILPTTKPIFIFPGRKENAFIPRIDVASEPNVRLILVVTRQEFDLLKIYLQPGIDILVIQGLASETHGNYENLGSINARRIAAFCFAMHLQQQYQVPTAMMSDDNIKTVQFPSDGGGNASWDAFFSSMTLTLEQEQTVCASLPTQSEKRMRRHHRIGELGSKLFMFNMEGLYAKLGDNTARWFLPFPPSKSASYWGEDYYFQLLFNALFAGQRYGYYVLDPKQYHLTRASSLPSLCRKVVKTANAWLQVTPKDLFEGDLARLETPDFSACDYAQTAISALQTLVCNNIKLHQRLLNWSQNTSLMRAHAWANGIEHHEPGSTIALPDEDFLTTLADKIREVQEPDLLRPYQQAILTHVREHLNARRFIAQFNLATGTGKTYIQIYLAIAALLTGPPKPIIIVTPYQQLVQQAYSDFMRVLQHFPELPIQPAQILKVDGEPLSIAAETLMKNRTLDGKPCVLIFCADSFAKICASENPALLRYKNPSMLLIDESHLQTNTLAALSHEDPNTMHTFIAGLSATPKSAPSLLTSDESITITYTREQAVADGHLAPCILDTFDLPYSHDSVMRAIQKLPELIRSACLPRGGILANRKGIIYVPNNIKDINYSKAAKQHLDAAGIPSFEINSTEPDALEKLKAYQANPHSAKIIICKGMAKIGFSDKDVTWVIYLQNGNKAEVCQSAGRCMHVGDENKIAYVIAFNDVKSNLIFQHQPTADEAALLRCTNAYRAQQQAPAGVLSLRETQKRRREEEPASADAEHPRQRKQVHTAQAPSQTFFSGGPDNRKRKRSIDDSSYFEEKIEELARERRRYTAAFFGLQHPNYFNHGKLATLTELLLSQPNSEERNSQLKKLRKEVIEPLSAIHPKAFELVRHIQAYPF